MAALLLITWRQTAIYKDQATLFASNIGKNDKAWLAHCHLAYSLSNQGRYDEAIPYYKRAIELNPDYADAFGSYGFALLQSGKVDEAIEKIIRAIEIEPEKPDAWNNLGVALLQKGERQDAKEAFQKAIRFRPSYIDALDNLAYCHLLNGDAAAARDVLVKATQIRPEDPRANEYLRAIAASKGAPNQAK
ncbi:tetratricopeptide repeat protein [Candidatus Sumerlaeota bacterium]|nr:tetratricopeptide repeat protein [Candidatus Sumerlaeota bacterium]